MFRTLRYEHPDSLRAILPECDPVLRESISQMLSGNFPEFDQAVLDEIDGTLSGSAALEPSFVRRGLYHEQLLRYLKCFSREQILVLDSARLKRELGNVLPEVARFLGLPEYGTLPADLPLFHVGQYEQQIAASTRGFLREFYRPHNDKLYELLGRDFGW
jgi:hypothetical protein